MKPFLPLLLTGLLAPSLLGQSPGPNPPRLAGFIASTVTPPQSGIRTNVFAGGSCGLETLCRAFPNQLPNPPAYAGGAAYDSVRRALWVTNGVDVGAYADDLNGTCTAFCDPVKLPGLQPNEIITGLAFRDYSRRLYATIVAPGIAGGAPQQRVAWFNIAGRCGITPVGTCPLTVPPSVSAGGVNYHYIVGGCDVFELFPVATGPTFGSYFVMSASLWEANIPVGAVRNYVLVNRIDTTSSSPCVAKCSPLVYPNATIGGQQVPLGPITGVALDAAANAPFGTHRIWACSSNVLVSALPIIPVPTDVPCSLNINGSTTCTTPHGFRYVGLSVMPGQANRIGASCTDPTCNNCAINLTNVGDPNFGNLAFGVQVTGGPPTTVGVVTFGAGNCAPNPAALCVGEYAPTGVLTTVPFTLSGSPNPCGGTAFVPWAAGATNLIGLTVSAQAAVFCGGAPATSNCLVWAWQGH